MNLTDIFLNELLKLSDRNIPDNIIQTMKYCFIDYLGVTLAGSKLTVSKFDNLFKTIEKNDECQIIGTSIKTDPIYASFINGISSHVIELDDGHRIGMVHPGSPVFSALLSIAEKYKLGHDDFWKGVLMGYEATVRLACAIQPGHKLKGYHATSTCGSIGAALGIAFALKYDFNQLKSTLSAAIASAGGILEMIEGDSEMKPFNVGKAAQNGVMSAFFGKSSFTSPDDPLGGKRGFLKVMSDNPKIEYLTEFNIEKYMIETIYMKPYAACRHCHPSIEAALKIRDKEGFEIEKIESIDVDTYKLAVEGHDHTEIKGMNSAKMSIPYSLAVALFTGRANLNEYTEETILNREIQNLTKKVYVTDIDELSNLCPGKRVAIVKIKANGKEFVERVDFPKGEPENPLSRIELITKFRGLAKYGGLTDNTIDECITRVLEYDFDAKKIMNLLGR